MLGYLSTIIHFKDINVKEALLASSDINPDDTREITYAEAANVTGAMLKAAINPNENNTDIVSFEELQYFTGITKLPTNCFKGCTNLNKVKLPSFDVVNGTQSFYGIFHGCPFEELHFEDVTELLASEWSTVEWNTRFGYLPNLKVIYINSLKKIQGVWFTAAQQPNVEKVVISSVQQWMDIVTNGSGRPTIGSSTGTKKVDLYLASDLEHPITDFTTSPQALSGVTTVPTVFENTFEGIKSIEHIRIGAQNTDVKAKAFYGVGSAVTIHNFEYISKVYRNSFCNCKAQGMTNIPPNITTVYEASFKNSALQKVESTNLTTLSEASCFSGSNITSVIANSVTTLSNSVFNTCPKLVNVSLNSAVTIPMNCFFYCINLETVHITSAVTIKESAFENDGKLITVDAPNVTTILDQAFISCRLLAPYDSNNQTGININLANCVKIGARAFTNCTNIIAPIDYLNLTYIGWGAFGGCIVPSGKYVIFRYKGVVTFARGRGNSSDPGYYYSIDTFGGDMLATTNHINTIYVPDDEVVDGVTVDYKALYEADTEWQNVMLYNNLPNLFKKISQLPT